MSKKLLEESTVRSFMKLANLQPLSQKFISENYGSQPPVDEADEQQMEEEQQVSEEDGVEVQEGSKVPKAMKTGKHEPPDNKRKPKVPAAMKTGNVGENLELEEDLFEELLEEDDGEEPLEEAREGGDKTPSSPRPSVKGTQKPGKVKGGHPDHKMTAAKTGGSHHTSDTDTISTKDHSTARAKNNKQFDVVAESLQEVDDEMGEGVYEEEMDAPEGGDMGSAGESPAHKEKMKDLINNMLDTLKNMASEYDIEMDISRGDEAPTAPKGGEEMAPPAGEEAMQEKLDEMVEKLTKRVAARLVKESKKRR